MFLNKEVTSQLKQEFDKFPNPVEIVYFTQKTSCETCNDLEILLKEVAEINDKIKLKTKNFVTDKEEAAKYKIDKVPAFVIKSEEKDFGVKFYGIPAGYEFTSFFEALRMIAYNDAALGKSTLEELKKVDKPVHIQIFVTPTCPYCPQSVVLSQRMAYVNSNITAEMVEASEFPELARKYRVQGVPRTVINENFYLEGAVPETILLEKILEAVGK